MIARTIMLGLLLAVIPPRATVSFTSDGDVPHHGACVSAESATSPFPDDYDEIIADDWRLIRLRADRRDGSVTDISLLRPLPWLTHTGAEEGGTVDLTMPEMGIRGPAAVVSIGPCPDLAEPHPGARPVTGKFVTTNAQTMDLHLAEQERPITATGTHPFWSLDREDWVVARDLKNGEKLQTLNGTATVESINPRPGLEPVYNIEVHRDHTYFASDATLLVHNGCSIGALDDLYQAATMMDRNGFTFAGRALQKHAHRVGSKWRTAATTASQYNNDAALQVMDILTSPSTQSRMANMGRVDFIHSSGRGIRFNGDGSFYCFLN